ncbi:MAG: 4-alpha-glucanotransferase, partial [Chloroflexota bacterium]|nr:4-alpha-glucanotransferase [Chloroflexota bacterium]
MEQLRASGILLHPTSLPGPDGIGDLGPEAYRWIDFLDRTGTQFWQVLPLGPTGYGDSPYQCFSAFAGNPYLISATRLLDQNFLTKSDLADRPDFPLEKVDYGTVIKWKIKILKQSFEHFRDKKLKKHQEAFTSFKESQKDWLDPFAIFMAIKADYGNVSWRDWPKAFRERDQETLKTFVREHKEDIEFQNYLQFIFNEQWQSLRMYAKEKGIRIIGDIPIFVAYDSADVWANKALFHLDR